jgi:hypothetical protein
MAQLVLAKQAVFDKPAKNRHMRPLYLKGYVNGKPFFLNENRGATPPGNRNNILTEETKLQRGGNYARPNQRLGNEGGQAKRETTTEKTIRARGGRGQHSNRAAVQEKL